MKTGIGTNDFWCLIFYFDPLLILNATSQTHDVAAAKKGPRTEHPLIWYNLFLNSKVLAEILLI